MVQELLAENQIKEDGKESVDASCGQIVEVCQPMDTTTRCDATGNYDPVPLHHDVSTQCCMNVRMLVNAETQTNESFNGTYCLSSDSQLLHANINTYLLDHNYYADHQRFLDKAEVEQAAEQAMEEQKDILTEIDLNLFDLETKSNTTSDNEQDEYHLPSSDSQSDDLSQDETDNNAAILAKTKNFIVNEKELEKLFSVCSTCGQAVVDMKTITKSSLLSVKETCLNGHTKEWNSQPYVDEMPLGNILIPAAVVLTGNTFAPISHFAACLNLQIVSKDTFYKVQDKYVIPVGHNSWHSHQKPVLNEIMNQNTPVNVAGDGRCDSPGHSAKYGTYSLLDESSGRVVDFSLVQVTEVSSSNTMEYEGCKRSLKNL